MGDLIKKQFKGKTKAEMKGNHSNYLNTDYLNGGLPQKVSSFPDVNEEDVLILWDGSQAGKVYHGFKGSLGTTLKAYKPKYSGDFLFQSLIRNQMKIYEQYRTPNIPHVIKDFTSKFIIYGPQK
ncbi:restriction endonuclease subunit S [Fructilactobacillus cliffordii]|uniref:restriction endonuclease subunit S n=1 Tax=Fructilactobacillus cliffordii TaxID=2940299 RepID=UPI0020920954|nr:restriction endonuclease subunit S [Fructilactobacillus cliffordii]USS86150.1 restriction endonuclease subunit S [Fructilactobacillus cliffordii]